MINSKGRFAVLFLVVILALAIGPRAVQSAEKLQIMTQLCCPLGCGSVTAMTIWGNFIAKKGLGFILRPQETPGYTYNIREMWGNKKRSKDTVFESTDNLIALANTAGGTPALKEFLPQRIPGPWKILYSLAVQSAGTWYITFDPNIKKISDLKGKKVGLGLKTQISWGQDSTFLLNQGYGINSKNTKLFYLGPAKMTEALLNRQVDAICMGLVAKNTPGAKHWLPSSMYMKLKASGRKLYYIPADPQVIEKINKKFHSDFAIETVKMGTLKDQQADILVATCRPVSAAWPSFPEELAYKYVMAQAKLAPEMVEYNAIWKFVWDLEGMVSGLTEKNAHPGAIKAYKELGIWDKRKEFKPFPF